MVNEYTERVEQTKDGVNMKDPDMDLFEWSRELAAKRQPAVNPVSDPVDYAARREVAPDGKVYAPFDADAYVRPNAAKKKGPATKKKKTDVEVDMADIYDG